MNAVNATRTLMGLLCGLGAVGCAEAARHHRVAIAGLEFQPEDLVVAIGDTVTWVNQDIVPHTVTFDGQVGRDEIGAGGEFQITVSETGVLLYRCRYHPSMTGSLRLE